MNDSTVKSFTLRYVPKEDRIHLSVIDLKGNSCVIFLTRRLLDEVVVILSRYLENNSQHKEFKNFEQAINQEDARQKRLMEKRSKPVRVRDDCEKWLCTGIRFAKVTNGMGLTLLNEVNGSINMFLIGNRIRHTIDILHINYKRAKWETSVFPSWVKNTGKDLNSAKDMRIN